MKITEEINKYIINPYTIDKRARFSHWPSEASVISRLDGNIMGKCHRASWYSWKGMDATNPIDARGQWTFAMGKMIEAGYVEYCKQLGIWAGNNVKFFDAQHNISGEADIFIFNEEKKIIGVEIKTAYGYGFQKQVTSSPKIENLLQVAIYLDYFQVPEWHLIYKARDTQEDVEYVITMHTNENNKKHLLIDGIPVYTFFMEDIYERFRILGNYVINSEIPPRDFTYGYDLIESEGRLQDGKITKTRFNAVRLEKAIDSDWQCQYCSYLDLCWKEKREKLRLKDKGENNENN